MNIMKAVKNTVAKATDTAKGELQKAKEQTPSGPMGKQPSMRDTFAAAVKPKVSLNPQGVTLALGGRDVASVKLMPGGQQLNLGPVRIDARAEKQGGNVEIAGGRYGAHFRPQDGVATLGAISLELGTHETSVGIVPAAPSPLPMPVYDGPVRDD